MRIPFQLNEADINCRVILLTDFPGVRLAVETPAGQVIDAGSAAAFGASFDTTTNLKTSRCNLPVAFQANKVHAGTWHARLEVDREDFKKALGGDSDRTNKASLVELRSKGAKYCLSIHSFSNLRMNASVTQSGFVPGSTLFLRAILTEYGVPVGHRAVVMADLEYPDKSHALIKFTEDQPGVFGVSLVAKQAGIYRFHVVAEGGTFRGAAFTREQLLNAAVWLGGDRPDVPPRDTDHCDWSRLLNCLLNETPLSRELEERLRKEGIDLNAIRRCVKAACGGGPARGDEQ